MIQLKEYQPKQLWIIPILTTLTSLNFEVAAWTMDVVSLSLDCILEMCFFYVVKPCPKAALVHHLGDLTIALYHMIPIPVC